MEEKTSTLNHLTIGFWYHESNYSVSIPINLSKFHQLRTLKINPSGYIFENQLSHSFFKNLEVFQTDCIYYDLVYNVIKNSGGHFRKILIERSNLDFEWLENIDDYAHAISENCPLIEYLPLVFSSSSFIEFTKLLKACQRLKVLSIFMVDVQ